MNLEAPSTAPEDVPLRGMSESLARGLVKRMTAGARAVNTSALNSVSTDGLMTAKRAAAYRRTRDLLRRTIPKSLQAWEYEVDATGKNKNGYYVLIHWDSCSGLPQADDDARGGGDNLVMLLSYVRARTCSGDTVHVCTISFHALMRLFYRLKTMSEAKVLLELKELVEFFAPNRRVISCLSMEAEVLVPTKSGAFVVARDRDTKHTFIAKTWMSDDRMKDNMRRLHAVAVARSESGFVVNERDGFPIISPSRISSVQAQLGPVAMKDILNRIADSAYPDHKRLPAEWRFVELYASSE